MNKKLIGIAIFFFIFFLAPQLLRTQLWGNMIGSTPYFHIRMAGLIQQGQYYDSLSFGGRPYTYPPGFHYLLAGTEPIWHILGPLIGAIGIILAYYLARELKFSENESLFVAALLGFLTGYMYLAGHLNPRLPALVMLVAAFLFFLRSYKNKLYPYLSAILLFLVLIFSPLVGIVGLIFGAVLFRRDYKKLIIPYSIAILLFLTWFVPIYTTYGMPQKTEFYNVYIELQSGVQFFAFESGKVSDSIQLLAIVFAVFAAFKLKSKQGKFLRDWLLLAILASLVFGNRLNEQLLFPIAFLATITVLRYWKDFHKALHIPKLHRKQNINLNIWLGLFFIYMTLAAILAGGALAFFPPEPAEYNGFKWLATNTPENAIVLSSWESGHWISAIGNRPNVIDAYAEYAPELEQRNIDAKAVIYGSDLEKALEVLRKYNVEYVYYKIDRLEMCSGFAYLSSSGYFENVFYEQGSKGVFIFKVNYNGNAQPFDICELYGK